MKRNIRSAILMGFLFGCCFPIIATIVQMAFDGGGWSFSRMAALHRDMPTLWIVDTAPVFLALMAWFAARRSEQLRKAAQRDLHAHQLRVLHTMDELPVGVFAVDATGTPVYANAMAIAILGKGVIPGSSAEGLAQEYQAYLAGTDQIYPTERLPLIRALAGETTLIKDMELERAGKRYPLEVTSAPILDNAGDVISAVSVFQDISDRINKENELKQSRAFLESVVQNLPTMLFVKDAKDLRFVRINRFGEELLGVSEADMLGKSDFDFFPKDQARFFIAKDREVLAGEGAVAITEEPITSLTKGRRFLRTHKVAILGNDGKPEYLLGISEDITELKSAEELNQKYMEDLQRAYRNLDQFAYVISHDLKAPMRGIRNLSEWIVEDLQGKVPESVEKHIRLLQDRTEKLERLINGVLEYSRSGRRKGATEEVDTAQLVAEQADLAGIRMPFQVIVHDPMPKLRTDKLLLAQVITNLMLNAVQHHTRPDGKLEISGRMMDENWAEFTLKDDGPGIPAHIQDRIFQLFFTQDTQGQGSGIGLSIVKKIVEDQGGTVELVSSSESGTEFRFTWPVSMQEIA